MMYIYYDVKTDYLEVFAKKAANYGDNIRKGVFEFRAEKNDDVIGYGIENASKLIHKVDYFDPFAKFSILIKMARLKRGFTQKQMAKKMGIELLPYQRLESGTNNPTLKTILKVKEVLPEIDLGEVA